MRFYASTQQFKVALAETGAENPEPSLRLGYSLHYIGALAAPPASIQEESDIQLENHAIIIY